MRQNLKGNAVFKHEFCVALLMVLSILSDRPQETESTFFSDFKTLEGWRDDSSTESPKSYKVDKEKGLLRISTRAETKDRVKVATKQKFSAGEYTWRVFVPEMGVGDQTCVAAFLYQDDKHEVDFEFGYGTKELRKKLGAKKDELVCYFTSQGFPVSSTQVLVKHENWYECSIRIAPAKEGNYSVEWFLNNVKMKALQTEFADETEFSVHCSVENLSFIGDHLPTQENYGIFDYFKFKPISEE